MNIKIISKKQYNELIKLLKEAYVIVTSLEAENKKLKKDLKDLQDFCTAFAADHPNFDHALNLDFPATNKPENTFY